MSHANTADKLLIKPAAGARPAPPHTRGQIIPKARTKRPVTRRVTRGTANTRLATAPDRPTRRVLPSLELLAPGQGGQCRAHDRIAGCPVRGCVVKGSLGGTSGAIRIRRLPRFSPRYS